ncbi:flagellar motor protein MotA [Celeribacter ethanolicus]|uniref:Flagellar motor protein MotA n=1 Tax=Celeribacter ethanolicus TaxID=1758178 RepID=A0A291GHY8_9RHOB|nr:flagellar motor protein MotA [Celeribacter ethanolicus]TNE68741.1 MAG: MotA/TolQ/ExbB proton channel family protein [Paracoccaceae bacterium]
MFQIISLTIYIALAALSFFTVSVAIYKVAQFARMGVGKRKAAEKILDDWLSGKVDRAVQAASKRDSVLARVLQAAFSGVRARPNDLSYAEELSRQTAIIELARMSERMRSLDMVVQSAPMLGLLGTVIGMIDAFSVLSQTDGAVDPTQLASGIYVALSTTAAGLAIALIAFFVATWCESRIDRERNMMEALMSASIHGRVDPKAKAA